MGDNRKELDSGIQLLKKKAYDHLVSCIENSCEELVNDAVSKYKSPIGSFTGNTITSYAIGLFLNGEFVFYYKDDSQKKPVRAKLKNGEWARLNPDYDGRNRSARGNVDTDGGFGSDYSYNFLKSYRPSNNVGIELVMCSGTEYSSYIETVLNGNVLTDTFKSASQVLSSNFKPMA